MQIWGDKWLPSPTTYTIQSPRQLLRIDATVSDRIDFDTKWWNGSLIHSIFSKEEADSITAIPLSKYGQPDLRIWRGTSTGEFMVQSAYHLEKERKEVQRGGKRSPFSFPKSMENHIGNACPKSGQDVLMEGMSQYPPHKS